MADKKLHRLIHVSRRGSLLTRGQNGRSRSEREIFLPVPVADRYRSAAAEWSRRRNWAPLIAQLLGVKTAVTSRGGRLARKAIRADRAYKEAGALFNHAGHTARAKVVTI